MSAPSEIWPEAREPIEVSVVAPVYKCGDCIPELHRQLVSVLTPLVSSFEVVLVNDGCPSNSWEIIKSIAVADCRVKAINLSRNFGQHYAIAAGLHSCRGKWIVVMDADLQDRPDEIPKLYRKALEGYDIVYALRIERQDRWTKRLISSAFSWVYNLFSDIQIDRRACNFSIASRQVIEGYCRLKELNRSYHLLLRWLGFRSTYIPVEHSRRFAGKSSYDLRRGFLLAIESVTSQSNRPLIMAIRAGFLMSGSAILLAILFVARYLMYHIQVQGWTSVIVSIYFIGGVILADLGVVGLYLGKVFNEVKQRPLFVIRDMINLDDLAIPSRDCDQAISG